MKQPNLYQLLDDEEDLLDSMKRVVLDDGDKILQSLPQKSPWKDKDAASTSGEAANGVGTQRPRGKRRPHLICLSASVDDAL